MVVYQDEPRELQERALAVRALHQAYRDLDASWLRGLLYWKLSSHDYHEDDDTQELLELMAAQVQEQLGEEFHLKKTPKILTIEGNLDPLTPQRIKELWAAFDPAAVGWQGWLNHYVADLQWVADQPDDTLRGEAAQRRLWKLTGLGTAGGRGCTVERAKGRQITTRDRR